MSALARRSARGELFFCIVLPPRFHFRHLLKWKHFSRGRHLESHLNFFCCFAIDGSSRTFQAPFFLLKLLSLSLFSIIVTFSHVFRRITPYSLKGRSYLFTSNYDNCLLICTVYISTQVHCLSPPCKSVCRQFCVKRSWNGRGLWSVLCAIPISIELEIG